jgi:uncharacterized repeat protein (TIGR02543 family)
MKLQKTLKQMCKAIAAITSAALIASCMLTGPLRARAATFSDCTGTGLSTDPYVITNAAQLAELATEVNSSASDNVFSGSCFVLGNSITLPDTENWTPIGYSLYGSSFAGTFDGKGYIISGLTIGTAANPNSNYSYIGLFGKVTADATIKNLNVSVSIYSSVSDSSVGALVGYSNGTIKNCTSSGTISASGSYVGGLIGYDNGGSIIGSSSSSIITNTADDAYVGGLIGESLGVSINSYATGSVTAGSSGYVGGFAGQTHSALNCYSTGFVTASGGAMSSDLAAGGFSGVDGGGDVFNCYSSGSVTVNTSSAHTYIGGFDGIEHAAFMSNCFSSTDTIAAPSGGTVYAGSFTGELAGNYTNCYDNSSTNITPNGSSVTDATYTGSATALSAAVFGGAITSISYTADGSATSAATFLVDALNGGNAVLSGSTTSPSHFFGVSLFGSYAPMCWENGKAGFPVYTSLAQIAVTDTNATLGFASPFGDNNASKHIYNKVAGKPDTDITEDTNTAISGDMITLSNLTLSTTYYYYIVFTDNDGHTFTSDVVSVETPALNHAPILTVTPHTDLTFIDDAISGTQLFTEVTTGVGDGDDGGRQHISSITLTVAGIKDSYHEMLSIGGTNVPLYSSDHSDAFHTADGFSVSVANSSSTSATVTISDTSADLSTWHTMIDNIKYMDVLDISSASPGTRTVTITGITDDGGTLYYGVDSSTCNYESDIKIVYGINYVMKINGATNSDSNPAMYDSTKDISLENPSADGYTFEGWYVDSGLVTPASSPTITSGNIGNMIFYAKWAADFDKYSGSTNNRDVTVPFTWNGDEVSGIYSGAYKLVENTDYTESDTMVTILKSYLTKLPTGDATLKLTFDAGSDQTFTVKVSDSTPTLQSIAVTTPATKLAYTVGDTLDISGLVVTGTYSDNSIAPVTVTADNVSGFHSNAPTASEILTITVDGKTTTYTVSINEAAPTPPTLQSIAVTTPATKLAYTVGDTLDISGLVVTGTYSDNSIAPVTVTADNVSGFHSNAPTASEILTITVDGKTTTYTVSINEATVKVTGLTLDSASKTLTVGGTTTLKATIAPTDATNPNVTWSSSKDSIATVDNTGKVVAVSAGAATITATAADGGYTASCAVTVNAASNGGGNPTTPADITITGTTTTTADGNSKSTATITPSQTNTSTVKDNIVKIGNITVTAPASVLNNALGDGTGLTLSQNVAASSTQTAAQAAAEKVNGTAITVIDIKLSRATATGTEAVHSLSGAVTVTISLTDKQLAVIAADSNAHIYYYDTDTGALTDMNATFDMTAKTAVFTTTHFSTYVISTTKATESTIGVTYSSHVQNLGWQGSVSDGALSGTTGKSLRLEAFNIQLTGAVPTGASITYEAHVQNIGWQKAVSNSAVAGTSGKSLRVEAVKITLSGLDGYEVQYRAFVQGKGWLGWQTTVNGTGIGAGAIAGTVGQSRRLEALEVRIVKIGS